MLIRPAVDYDVAPIMELVRRVVPLMNEVGNFQWSSTYPNEKMFTNDVSLNQLWVAEINGVIAGVSAVTTEQTPEYSLVGWDIKETAIVTHRLAVDPRFRGEGIAAGLLYKAEEIAIARGIAVLRVDTNSKNQAAQKLFPKAGYKSCGEIPLNFRPGLLFYCYEKRI